MVGTTGSEVQSEGKDVCLHSVKACRGGTEVLLHSLLTLALVGGEWSDNLLPRKGHGIIGTEGWVGLRAGLEKFCRTEINC